MSKSESPNTHENMQLLYEVNQLRLKIDHAMYSHDPVKFRQCVGKLTMLVQNWQAALPKETP